MTNIRLAALMAINSLKFFLCDFFFVLEWNCESPLQIITEKINFSSKNDA